MALLSPGIETREISLQTTIARSSTGRAALVGKFNWGPAFQVSQVISEVDLVDRFGQPDDTTADSFFSGTNFLQYGNDLRLVRVVNEDTALNESAIFETIDYEITIEGTGYSVGSNVEVDFKGVTVPELAATVSQIGENGGIEKISFDRAAWKEHAIANDVYPDLSDYDLNPQDGTVTASASISEFRQTSNVYFPNDDYAHLALTERSQTGDTFLDLCEEFGVPAIAARYPGENTGLTVIFIAYEDYYTFDGDTITGVNTINPTMFPIDDEWGNITPSSFLEFGPQNTNQFAMLVFRDGVSVETKVLSTKEGDRDIYGSSIYINEYFENGLSTFVQGVAQSFPVGFTGGLTFGGGSTGNDVGAGDFIAGWDMFADREHQDVNLFIAGACAGEGAEIASTVQKSVVAIVEERQDSLAFMSPPSEFLINLPVATAVSKVVGWGNGRDDQGAVLEENLNVSSSYIAIDGNYKYQYDKYADRNRWIPLAGDMAGLAARTDSVGQPWMSPAGFNRGQIQNVVKLAIETRQAHRDSLYQATINPVVGFSGQGYILYGDKTGTTAPTPFDRINVRRLFNLLKKSISESAKYKLFEINDEFTRSSFTSEVSAYLDTIRSLGGVYDFRVICDDTNNPGTIIDRNEFVATIMVQPARSINFITLNFVATATGADFDELIGQANF